MPLEGSLMRAGTLCSGRQLELHGWQLGTLFRQQAAALICAAVVPITKSLQLTASAKADLLCEIVSFWHFSSAAHPGQIKV